MGGHWCSHLGENDRDKWQAVVNTVMNLLLIYIYIYSVGNFLITETLLIFQEGLCSMEQTFITLFTKACHSILTQVG